MNKLQEIGKIYRIMETICSIVVFCFLLFDRFDNVFFLPHRLKSGALLLVVMFPPLVYSLIQLFICGWGIVLIIRDRLWSETSCISRWIIRVLLLMLIMMHLLYNNSEMISSFDDSITDKYITFVIDLFDISNWK